MCFPCVVYSVTLVLNIVPCSVEETVFTVVAIIKYSASHCAFENGKRKQNKKDTFSACSFKWSILVLTTVIKAGNKTRRPAIVITMLGSTRLSQLTFLGGRLGIKLEDQK